MDLTDKQWAVLEPIFRPRRRPDGHRRFQLWQRSGRLDLLLQRLAENLRDRGRIDLFEAFVDATFAPAKKGGLPLALPAVVKGAPPCPRDA